MNKLQLSFMRLLHNPPVKITNKHMGSQSVLFVPTHELSLCSQEHHDRLFLVMQLTNFLESKTFMKPH